MEGLEMSRGKDFLKGILVGGVSAGIALLFAPKSGKELRQDLKESGKDLAERGKIAGEDLMDRSKVAFEDLSQDIQTSIKEVEEDEAVTRVSDQKALEDAIIQQEQEIADDIIEHSETAVTDEGEITSIERPRGEVEEKEEEIGYFEATPEDELTEALKDQDIDDLSELD